MEPILPDYSKQYRSPLKKINTCCIGLRVSFLVWARANEPYEYYSRMFRFLPLTPEETCFV